MYVECNKYILYERNPPSPFSVEFIKSYFIFSADEAPKGKYSLIATKNDHEGLIQSLKKYEALFKRVRTTDDEDQEVQNIFFEKYNKFKN